MDNVTARECRIRSRREASRKRQAPQRVRLEQRADQTQVVDAFVFVIQGHARSFSSTLYVSVSVKSA
jgi:hypothetical protein